MVVVVVVVVVVGGGGYGSEGANCRRGIINIIFHSSEANLFLKLPGHSRLGIKPRQLLM